VVVKVALDHVLELLVEETEDISDVTLPSPEWVAAAVTSVDGENGGFVSYDDFVDICEQYCDLLAIAGFNLLDRPSLSTRERYVAPEGDEAPLQARVERLCRQAFYWVDDDRLGLVTSTQAKTTLTLVFTWVGAPTPPDAWYEATLVNFSSDEDENLDFDDVCDIAVQHCLNSQRTGHQFDNSAPLVESFNASGSG
jgi:hypothetical protein